MQAAISRFIGRWYGKVAVGVAVLFALGAYISLVSMPIASRPGTYGSTEGRNLDGFSGGCRDYWLGTTDWKVAETGDPGWAWVDPVRKYRSVTGYVLDSHFSYSDFPAMHYSHDKNVNIKVDPGYEDLVAVTNYDTGQPTRRIDASVTSTASRSDEREGGDPEDEGEAGGTKPPPGAGVERNTMGIEWESGLYPTDVSPGTRERFYPRWAWPATGDRVWANGSWIYDCGHPDSYGRYESEIHPARAEAAIRSQVAPVEGSGGHAVPITAVDLWIHGEAGLVTDVLNCGQEAWQRGERNFRCPDHESPIAEDFSFDVPLPTRPSTDSRLAIQVETGEGNTLSTEPRITPIPPGDPRSLHIEIPLAGSGATGNDAYGRRIRAGWIGANPAPVRRFKLSVEEMELDAEVDQPAGECKCSFFFMSVNRDPSQVWKRLADFSNANMDAYSTAGGFGGIWSDGRTRFTGLSWEYSVTDEMPIGIHVQGFDQNCLDTIFGDTRFSTAPLVACYLVDTSGDNQKLKTLDFWFLPGELPTGVSTLVAGNDYKLKIRNEELPVSSS